MKSCHLWEEDRPSPATWTKLVKMLVSAMGEPAEVVPWVSLPTAPSIMRLVNQMEPATGDVKRASAVRKWPPKEF